MRRIYMDYNATSIMYDSVKQAMIDVMSLPLNPSSIHSFGRDARSMIEKARSDILSLLGTSGSSYNLTFLSSGTEANNLIMHNFKDSRILVSATEHLSIIGHKRYNDKVDILDVDGNGIVKFDMLELWLQNNPNSLVSVMMANNETGVIQPVADIANIVHKYGSFFHSDIVQSVSKIKVNLEDLDIDFATISAHKFGGPVGSAALVSKLAYNISPQIIGGGQEKGVRSGTQNVAGIVGFGVAALEAQNLDKNNEILKLRNLLEEELLKIESNLIIFGKDTNRLPNTSMISVPNKDAKEKIILFDLNNIAISNGSACSSGKVKSSHVLEAMGFKDASIAGAIRISLGRGNTKKDIDKFINIWQKNYA